MRRGRSIRYILLCAGLVVVPAICLSPLALSDDTAPSTELVSKKISTTNIGVPDADSNDPVLSEDGRYVAFESDAETLDLTDTDANDGTLQRDVFLYDTVDQELTVITQGGDDDSFSPSISKDGRYVAFASDASNLVSSDRNGRRDVFIYDSETGSTRLLSSGRKSSPRGGTMSAPANDDSDDPAISGDGSYVAFSSDASNLVSGDTNGQEDVFVRPRSGTGRSSTERVSQLGSTEGDSASFEPSISEDGEAVVFATASTTFSEAETYDDVDVFIWYQNNSRPTLLTEDTDTRGGDSRYPAISGDANTVVFASAAGELNAANGVTDAQGEWDIFISDLSSGTVDPSPELISLDPGGQDSDADSTRPSISSDGSVIAFESDASDLTFDNGSSKDVFRYDRATGTITTLSLDSSGAGTSADSEGAAVSADGTHIAFDSRAIDMDLYGGDGFAVNAWDDVFVWSEVTAGSTILAVTSQSADQTPDNASSEPAISADGRYVAFTSDATNLVSSDGNGMDDIFVHTRW